MGCFLLQDLRLHLCVVSLLVVIVCSCLVLPSDICSNVEVEQVDVFMLKLGVLFLLSLVGSGYMWCKTCVTSAYLWFLVDGCIP